MTGTAGQSRWWIAGGVLVAVLLAAGSWLMLIGPKLDDADSVRAQAQSASDQNTVLQIKVNKLRADSASMPDLLRQLDTLHAQLPTSSGLDAFTRQLSRDAADAGVTLTSIVIGVPTVVKASSAPKAAPTGETAGTAGSDAAGSAGAGSGSGDASDAASTPGAATSTQPAAPAAATSLYTIPVTVAATGRLADQRTLLHAIQAQGPRGALVSSVQFAPAPEVADRPGGEPGDAQPSGAPGTTVSSSGDERASGTARATGTAQGTVQSTGTVPAGGAGAADDTAVTMTVQLAVFVAPQTPDDEAALRKQLGG